MESLVRYEGSTPQGTVVVTNIDAWLVGAKEVETMSMEIYDQFALHINVTTGRWISVSLSVASNLCMDSPASTLRSLSSFQKRR